MRTSWIRRGSWHLQHVSYCVFIRWQHPHVVFIYIVSNILVKRFFGHMRPESELVLLIVENMAIEGPGCATN